MSGRGCPVIPPSLKEEEELRAIAGSRTLRHGKVQRAQIVLGCAEGESQGLIAKGLGSPLSRLVNGAVAIRTVVLKDSKTNSDLDGLAARMRVCGRSAQ